MSISNFSPRVELVGNGVQVAFTLPCEVTAAADVKVYVAGVLQTLTTHYTVSGIGTDTTIITFVAPPANAASVVMFRDTVAERSADYSQFGALKAATLNAELDKIWAVIQQIKSDNTRLLQFSEAYPITASTALPLPTADTFLAWDGTGSAIVNHSITASGAIVDATTTLKGIVELATDAEAQTMASTTVAITASNLAGVKASVSETLALTSTARFVSPAGLGGALAENTLTDGATITPNFATSLTHVVTLGGNRTLANPTNPVTGTAGHIRIVQDATGSRTLSFGSNWKWASGTAPTMTTTANAVDILFFKVISPTFILGSLVNDAK